MLPNPPFIIEESAVKYNTKDLFFAGFDSGQAVQIGPNGTPDNGFTIVISSMTDIADSFPTPATPMPGTFTAADFMDFARIQMDELKADVDKINNTRALLGTQASALGKIINDINIAFINMSSANSKISEVDVEQAVSELKQNILTQATLGTAMSHFMDMRKLDLEFLNVLPIYMKGTNGKQE
jgi:flagellin-like hook-associated protein FlgL